MEKVNKILIVDDNLLCRSITAKCFEKIGFQTYEAKNGHDALKRFNCSISLVVTDIEMPIMNGYQLAHKIHEKNPSTPVVAMTSLSSSQLARQQAQAFIEVVDKPVTQAKCKRILAAAGLSKPVTNNYDERLLRAV